MIYHSNCTMQDINWEILRVLLKLFIEIKRLDWKYINTSLCESHSLVIKSLNIL